MADKLPPLPPSIARVLHGDEPVYFATQMHVYAEQHAAELSKTIGELRAELSYAQAERDAAVEIAALNADGLRARNAVLAGLLRECYEALHDPEGSHLWWGDCPTIDQPKSRNRACHGCGLLDRIDAALGPAADDLLTGESK